MSTGCGYIGPVVPPSPMLPAPVSNLSVTERGNKLVIVFSTPSFTTDALNVKHISDVDLRMGPAAEPVDLNRWQEAARRYDIAPPPDTDPDDPKPTVITKTIPASEWKGKKITVAVRTAIKGESHFSQWSNPITLDVVEPLQAPVVEQTATREGYRLNWAEQRVGLHYQVFRSGPADKTPVQIGTAEKPEFIDSSSEWDVPYKYTVVAQEGANVESLPSNPVDALHADTFAPSVPADLTAVAGPDSIEVSWSRSPEHDLKGYLVYRATGNSSFAVVGELTSLPTFSDRKAEHGHTYRYAISSVDQKNNESDKSAPIEVAF